MHGGRFFFCFLVQELRNFFRGNRKRRKRKISSIKAAKCSLSYFAAFIICSTTKKKERKTKNDYAWIGYIYELKIPRLHPPHIIVYVYDVSCLFIYSIFRKINSSTSSSDNWCCIFCSCQLLRERYRDEFVHFWIWQSSGESVVKF